MKNNLKLNAFRDLRLKEELKTKEIEGMIIHSVMRIASKSATKLTENDLCDIFIKKMEDAGIADYLFEKKEEIVIVIIQGNGKSFEIEVSKNGAYHKKSKTHISIAKIESAIKRFKRLNSRRGVIMPIITHMDNGKIKMIPIEEWERVISAYKSLISKHKSKKQS